MSDLNPNQTLAARIVPVMLCAAMIGLLFVVPVMPVSAHQLNAERCQPKIPIHHQYALVIEQHYKTDTLIKEYAAIEMPRAMCGLDSFILANQAPVEFAFGEPVTARATVWESTLLEDGISTEAKEEFDRFSEWAVQLIAGTAERFDIEPRVLVDLKPNAVSLVACNTDSCNDIQALGAYHNQGIELYVNKNSKFSIKPYDFIHEVAHWVVSAIDKTSEAHGETFYDVMEDMVRWQYGESPALLMRANRTSFQKFCSANG